MSLERNLIAAVVAVLLASLLAGAALTYEHAASRVHTEMNAALAVGRRVVQNAVDDSAEQPDPNRRLARIVAAFDGDRHLRAVVTGPHGATLLQSTLQPPADPAPRLFLNLVAPPTPDPAAALPPRLAVTPARSARIPLPAALQAAGTLTLFADAHNEAAEAWDDVKLDLSILGVFFALVLALVVTTLRRAIRPLRLLRTALTHIAAGDYAIRLAPSRTRELAQLQAGFNAMAARLADMEIRNRLLQTRVQRVQEEERAELARDLHDEVAPFLFAVSADASLIRRHAAAFRVPSPTATGGQREPTAIGGQREPAPIGGQREPAATGGQREPPAIGGQRETTADPRETIDARAAAILASVGHMQRHLRHVLSRLMPDLLLDLGLAGAIEALVHGWAAHRPDIAFAVQVDAATLDDRRTAVAFRVIQESLSNAVRHASPTRVDVRVAQAAGICVVEVTDNGTGLPPPADPGRLPSAAQGSRGNGLGLLGMRERVTAIGGHLTLAASPGSGGLSVRAELGPAELGPAEPGRAGAPVS